MRSGRCSTAMAEEVRVRTFARLENIYSLGVLAYVYVTRYLRRSRRFRRIAKVLGDNVSEFARKTQCCPHPW